MATDGPPPLSGETICPSPDRSTEEIVQDWYGTLSSLPALAEHRWPEPLPPYGVMEGGPADDPWYLWLPSTAGEY